KMFLWVEQLDHVTHHFCNVVFQFPFLTLRSMPISWRIEDDAVVLVAPLQLALHELKRILHHPADIRKARQLLVFVGPSNDLLTGVYVCGIRASGTCYERSSTGIGKRIEHLRPRRTKCFDRP